jgi:glycosyltransferase involved in cell wall biosynthesis
MNENNSKKDIFVSVVMITYNHENYISKAIEGVLMQEIDCEIELIIADDCSPDNTEDIVRNFIINHPKGNKINYKRHSKNLGMMGNFVWALNQAKGDYIALCDGDDFWTDPFKLQKQIDFLENNKDYVMCFHKCEIHFSDSIINWTESQSSEVVKQNTNLLNFLSNYQIPTASIVYRNVLKIFPDFMFKVESGDICLVFLLYQLGKFYYLDEKMSVYRRRIGQGASANHHGLRLIHHRILLYHNLNEFFEYKYEKEIFTSLLEIFKQNGELYTPCPDSSEILAKTRTIDFFVLILSRIPIVFKRFFKL